MTILLKRILWYRLRDRGTELVSDNIYQDPIDITDDVAWTGAKGLDIKNNVLTITLRNANSLYVENNLIKFEEQDQIKVYLKHTDDNDDVTTAWDTDSSTFPSSTDLVGVYYIIEFAIDHSQNTTIIKLVCADKTYVLFNKLYAKNYLVSDGLTAAEIIQDVVRFSSQNQFGEFSGTRENAGVFYDIDAKMDYEGGFIETTRADSTAFPDTAISKVWKPIYEWVKDLSQLEKTNSATEISTNALVQPRAMIFWVDENNRFHWVYPTDIVDSTLVIGTDIIISSSFVKKVFDVVNMVIFNAGTDLYETGIWNYKVDTTSTVRTLKMRVVPMVDIAESLIQKDYGADFNPAADREAGAGGKGDGYPVPQFPKDAQYNLTACAFVPTTSYAAAANITNDSDYNSALRERATDEGSARAQAILSGLAIARWMGNLEVRGTLIYSPGDLIQYTDAEVGIYQEKLRLMKVQHNVGKNGWFTTLTLENDPKEQ